MNDFTKQDLKCLHNAISLQLRDIPMSETNSTRRSELLGKLQSIIDNHDCQVIDAWQCEKCGHLQ